MSTPLPIKRNSSVSQASPSLSEDSVHSIFTTPSLKPKTHTKTPEVTVVEGGERLQSYALVCTGKGVIGVGMVCNAACTLGGAALGALGGMKISALGGVIGLVVGSTFGSIQGATLGHKLAKSLFPDNPYKAYATTAVFGSVGLIVGFLGGGVVGIGLGSIATIGASARLGSLLGGYIGGVLGSGFSCIGGGLMEMGGSEEASNWKKISNAPLTNLYNSVAGPGTTLHSNVIRPALMAINPSGVWKSENQDKLVPSPWTQNSKVITNKMINTPPSDGNPSHFAEIKKVQMFIDKRSQPVTELTSSLNTISEFTSKSNANEAEDNRKALKNLQKDLNRGICFGTSMSLMPDTPLDATKIQLFQMIENLKLRLNTIKNNSNTTTEDKASAETHLTTIQNIRKELFGGLEVYPIKQPISKNLKESSTLKSAREKLNTCNDCKVEVGIFANGMEKGHSILLSFKEGNYSLYDRNLGQYKYESKTELLDAFELMLKSHYPKHQHVLVRHTTQKEHLISYESSPKPTTSSQ